MAEGTSNKNLIIFLAVLPFLVIAALLSALYINNGQILPKEDTTKKSEKVKVKSGDVEDDEFSDEEDMIPNTVEGVPNYEFYTLEGLTVNPSGISDGKGRLRILVVKIGMQVKPLGTAIEEITSKEIIIRDSVNYYLATKDIPYLGDPKNRDEMKERILKMMNKILKKSKVMKISFPTYIIQ
ncbi:MAG: flagellar basal body-associated FliL family protein [Candidatus Delongbacteria bacterium]|nr:flagellar basal body-associated FliL family protein [Candidatus Delongbacteria bacterium]MBN2834716.1 flagellar basal body-associated FliL family protein [Candidatus Delongbacteria bacterium]